MEDLLTTKFRQALWLLQRCEFIINDKTMSSEARGYREDLLALCDKLSMDSNDLDGDEAPSCEVSAHEGDRS